MLVDAAAALAILVASLAGALLCTGSRGRRLLGLAASSTTLVPPWFARPSAVQGLFCLGAALAIMRALDLVRDPSARPSAWRIWHVLSPVDSRLLRRAPISYDGAALALSVAWLLTGAAGCWIASVAGSSLPLRWLGGLVAVYSIVEALWTFLGGLYRLLGFEPLVLHRNPTASRSVGELWGVRWSRPVGRWLDSTCFKPCARRGFPRAGVVAAFLASGVLHGYAVFVCAGTLMACTMVAYFLTQGLLLLLERSLGVQRWGRTAAHAWLLSVMILTSPLFTEPFLRSMGL